MYNVYIENKSDTEHTADVIDANVHDNSLTVPSFLTKTKANFQLTSTNCC